MALSYNQNKLHRIYHELEEAYRNFHIRYREDAVLRALDVYIYLREHPNRHSLSELAEVFGVSKRTMKRYTDLLYMVGLCNKKPIPGGGVQVTVI